MQRSYRKQKYRLWIDSNEQDVTVKKLINEEVSQHQISSIVFNLYEDLRVILELLDESTAEINCEEDDFYDAIDDMTNEELTKFVYLLFKDVHEADKRLCE